MKLKEWAKEQGISYITAYRWFKRGILPAPSVQLPTGTILVNPPKPEANGIALYARVSSRDQKADLERQLSRLAKWTTEKGMAITKTTTEIGSGLNGRRPKLLSLLRDPTISTIIVEHRDRLARFGSEYIEAALAAMGRKILVIDKEEMKDDLVQDMIDVLTSFCARLYGRRSAKNKAKKALRAIEE